MQRIQVEKDSQAKAKLAYFFSILVIAIRAPSVQVGMRNREGKPYKIHTCTYRMESQLTHYLTLLDIQYI